MLAFSYIDRVVVNGRVAHRTGHIDAPRVIVLADVVAHNRAHVSCVLFGIKAAFVAVQEEAAVIIVAIVVLDEGVARVPVGIETFAVATVFTSGPGYTRTVASIIFFRRDEYRFGLTHSHFVLDDETDGYRTDHY